MSAPIVQVLFKDRMLKSISFEGDSLRIGRLRQNDVVIDNLSVSRFHATLTRRDGRTYLEDCGSENGCFVNGMRVERTEVRPGDEILIGKHQLVLRNPGEAEGAPPRPAAEGPAEPWDGQKTYMMGRETMDGVLSGAAPPAPAGAPRGEAPGRAAAGSIAADPPPGSDDYDVSMDELPEISEPDAADPVESSPAGARYPGFVMQTDGRFERVLRWDADRLALGRSSDCDIVLSHPEVSRRHALFHREGDRFEVRDLDSINGTQVNGKRVKRQELSVGDVVKIENFEFTFVLEPQPIGNEVKTETMPPRRPQRQDDDLTVLEERSPLEVSRPSSLDEETSPSGTSALAIHPEPHLDPHPEAHPEPNPEPNPIREVPPAVSSRLPEPAPGVAVTAKSAVELAPSASPAPGGELRLEIQVALDDLPPALREALEDAGSEMLPVRAELRLVRGKSEPEV